MELTREVTIALAECTLLNCKKCKASKFCGSMSNNDIEKSLASALLAEIDKPKVWDGAPEYAGMAMVTFAKSAKESSTVWSKVYYRELPKSRAREIAEEAAKKIRDYDYFHEAVDIKQTVAGIIESAILRDREERKE